MRLERHIVREPARCAGTRNGTSDLMRAYARLNIAAACLTIGAVSAQAQSVPGDVERGRELAERVCSNCHKVKADPAAPVSTDVLSFPSIANRPGVSAEVAGRPDHRPASSHAQRAVDRAGAARGHRLHPVAEAWQLTRSRRASPDRPAHQAEGAGTVRVSSGRTSSGRNRPTHLNKAATAPHVGVQC